MKGKFRILASLAATALITLSASAAPPEDVWEKPFQADIPSTSVLLFGPDAGDCFPLAKAVIQGAGTASYMGIVVDNQSHCVNPATGEATDGEYTFAADDGTIFGTYTAQLVPSVNCPDPSIGDCRFLIFGQFTVDGGTGRYETVLPGGGGSAGGVLDGSTGGGVIHLNGLIRSDGSIKGEY